MLFQDRGGILRVKILFMYSIYFPFSNIARTSSPFTDDMEKTSKSLLQDLSVSVKIVSLITSSHPKDSISEHELNASGVLFSLNNGKIPCPKDSSLDASELRYILHHTCNYIC